MCPVNSLRTETKFKKTEIGEIPVDWELMSLGKISTDIYRYPTYYNIKYVKKGIPEVRGELIRPNGAIEKKLSLYRFISEDTASKFPRTRLVEGDFVISVRGTLGKIAMIPKSLEGANITANLIRISPDRRLVHSLWLNQIFLSKKFQQEINNASSSTTIKTIRAPEIKSFKFAVPPFLEQIKIADILSSVDEAIEEKREIIEKTKELKKGLMQKLLTCGIGHTKLKKTEIGEIPVAWEMVSTIDILKRTHRSIKIGPFGSQLKKENFVQSGYKIYGQENVFSKDFTLGNRRIDKTRFDLLSSFQLYPGDVVITMMGTIGECAIVPDDIEPGIMDSHLLRLEIDEKKYSKELLAQLFSSSSIIKKQIKQLSVGGIMEGLSSKIVKKLIFPYPPIQEQKRIAGILLSADQDIQKKAEQEGNLEILKNGLAEKLLAGKLRVSK